MPSAVADSANGDGAPPNFTRLRALWDQLLIEFRRKHPSLQVFMQNVSVSERQPGKVALGFQSDFHVKQMSSKRRIELVESHLREVTGESWSILVELDAAAGESGPPKRFVAPSEKLREDPVVKKAQELFRGRLV